jgi:hypothetical protein
MTTLQDYRAEWLVTIRSKLRPTTHHSYAAVARVCAHLGRYQLQTLTPLQIELFYAEQLASGGRDGAPLAPKTVRNTMSCCAGRSLTPSASDWFSERCRGGPPACAATGRPRDVPRGDRR